jgi:ABC-type branched-subunit amino acid transport system substrate-binding protein
MPVVGTDGMLIDQYTDPWVWPVAASTITTMHIMAKNAYDRGARTFGLVYDQNYRFGVEGAAAFRGALKRLGGTLKADVGIQAGQNSYTTDIQNRFNKDCSDCDFVAMLLEPQTAVIWIKQGGYLGNAGKAIGVGGPQTLFSDHFANDFAQNCPQPCNTTFWVWTGFKPPQPPFDTDPAVQTYVNDLKATNSSADQTNQFVEGGYDGMQLLIHALQQAGAGLTRKRLQSALDQMDFDSGLSTPRSFRAGNHFANVSMQAFSIVLNGQNFTGWRYERTGWITDPWVGLDTPK